MPIAFRVVSKGGNSVPRKRRFAPPGFTYHVINRGNDRRRIFFEDTDYEEFLRLLNVAKRRYPVKVFGICMMPNHFHGLMMPLAKGALSTFLQWVEGRYACDLRSRTRTTGQGHVFQRRFWSSGIEEQRHFLSVLRYVEANPSRARLVERAEDWIWASLALRDCDENALLDPLPYALPPNWVSLVNSDQIEAELTSIRFPEKRGRRGRPRFSEMKSD
jgi:putative transposase